MKAKTLTTTVGDHHPGLRHTVDMKHSRGPGVTAGQAAVMMAAAAGGGELLPGGGGGTVLNTPEMTACFVKLREIVPALSHQQGAKLSKVQVLQGVIDYIMDLELTLDFDVSGAEQRLTGALSAGLERRPLCENTHSNTQNAALSGGCESGASSC